MMQRRVFLKLSVVFLVSIVLLSSAAPAFKASETLPNRISDDVFWQMVSDFSEPDGFFRFENFLSNELAFQFVIPDLVEGATPGGVYLGVGPEQNFTYLAALQPEMAFIVDIRRQNMIEHMWYKALFELSADRADFVSHLYARKRPPGLNDKSTARELFAAYRRLEADPALAQKNISAIKDLLISRHKFGLSAEDQTTIEYVYKVFIDAGPALDYSYGGGAPGGPQATPTYADLMIATDEQGQSRSYLATEENYGIVREMERRNLIVPLVGDFAGPKTLLAIGQYIKDHDSKVTAFYTSNVEQYLFQQGNDWRRFYSNVETLPTDSSSVFIRSVNGQNYPRLRGYRMRFQSVLSPISDLLKAFGEERIRYYSDIIRLSR